jgi:hypothetical protein
LRGPGNQDLDAALRRSFNLPKDIGTFVFEVDCINVWNKVVFSNPASTFGSSNFGQISSVSGSGDRATSSSPDTSTSRSGRRSSPVSGC